MKQLSKSFFFFIIIFLGVNGAAYEMLKTLDTPNVPSKETDHCEQVFHENKICQFIGFLGEQSRKLLHENKIYTIFALTDRNLAGNKTRNLTTGFVSQYVYPGRYDVSNIRDGERISSVDHQHLVCLNLHYERLTRKTTIWIQGVEVTTPSLKLGNSILHVIEQTLKRPQGTLFEYLKNSGKHNFLFSLLKKFKLYFQFPFGVTFFAPLDEAFDKIPQKYKEKILKNGTTTRVSSKK